MARYRDTSCAGVPGSGPEHIPPVVGGGTQKTFNSSGTIASHVCWGGMPDSLVFAWLRLADSEFQGLYDHKLKHV